MRLFSEIWRRKVLSIAVAYWLVSWGLAQVADNVFPIWCIPEAAIRFVWIAAFLGFPIAVAFSWRFELSIQGIRRTAARDEASGSIALGNTDYWFLGGLSLLAVAIVSWMLIELYEQRNCGPDQSQELLEQTLDEFGLAVLPPHAAGEQVEVVAIGIFNELQLQAARIEGVHLVPRFTIEALNAAGKTAADIVNETSAGYILDTSVLAEGPNVIIDAQLYAGRDSRIAWVERFNVENDPASIQDLEKKIVRAIAKVMGLALPEDCVAPLYTPDSAAWRDYQLGRQQLDRGTTGTIEQAIGYLENAIDIEPDYAEALTSLAVAYRELKYRSGRWPAENGEERFRELVLHALELDGCLGEALAARARWLTKGQIAEREAELQRALELSPKSAFVYAVYGEFLFLTGRVEEALDVFERGILEHPHSASLYSWAGVAKKRLESVSEAEEYYRQALRLDPDFVQANEYLAVLLWNHTRRLDEAMVLLRDAYAIDPEYIEIINLIAWIYLDLGDDAEAERWARHAFALAPQDCRVLDALADVYHARDDHVREFELLNLDICGPGTMGSTEARLLAHYSCEGRYAEAIAIARAWQPVLFDPDEPIVDFIVPAYNIVAYIYSQTGRPGQAEDIWRRLLESMDTRRADLSLNQLTVAQTYAAQKQPVLSLDALEKATGLGWRWLWKFFLDDCLYDFVRDDPRFQAVVTEIEADVKQQLARVRELERAGQLAMLP